jgi:predicted membrane protein (TIGR00267 family)
VTRYDLGRLSSFIEKAKVYIRITRASGIARRYFVLNGFDGAMTVFGIVLGSWVAGVVESSIIILAGFVTSLAMGLSGFFGALLAERAEREGHLKELEAATNDNVEQVHYDAARFVTFYVALVDGLSPAFTAIISLAPFLLVRLGWITIWSAYIASLSLSLATLFLLGIFLGKVAKGSWWFYGLMMLTAGAFAALIVFLIQLF